MKKLTSEQLKKIASLRQDINKIQLLRLSNQLQKSSDLKKAKVELAKYFTALNAPKKTEGEKAPKQKTRK